MKKEWALLDVILEIENIISTAAIILSVVGNGRFVSTMSWQIIAPTLVMLAWQIIAPALVMLAWQIIAPTLVMLAWQINAPTLVMLAWQIIAPL